MIPNTAERVPLHTSQSVNREIENQIAHSVRWHAAHPIEPLEVHCTMQAVRLLRGHGNASLKDAAAHFLGLDIPKELQRSDWSAPDLAVEQINYAGLDGPLRIPEFTKHNIC